MGTIRESWEADPVLQKIRQLLQEPEPPSYVNGCSMVVVIIRSQRNSLIVLNGVLHRNFETADERIEYQQILVPVSSNPENTIPIYLVHGYPISGHWSPEDFWKTTVLVSCSGWETKRILNILSKVVISVAGTERRLPDPMQSAIKKELFQLRSKKFISIGRVYTDGVLAVTSISDRNLLFFAKYIITVPLRDKSALTVSNMCIWSVGLSSSKYTTVDPNLLILYFSIYLECWSPRLT